VFVLDAGEMLLKGLHNEEDAERTSRAETVLGLATQLGLDAWAPARIDVRAAGAARLLRSPAVSANARDLGLELPASRVLERGGVRLGVIGLSGEDSLRNAPGRAVQAVREALQPGAADAWVLLSNAPAEVNRLVAEQVPGLGIVLATRGDHQDPPLRTSGAPVVELPDRGRYLTVGRVALAAASGAWALDEAGPLARLGEARELAVRAGPEARDAARARAERAREKVAEQAAGRRLAHFSDQPLGTDLDGPSALDSALRAWASRSEAEAEARAVAPAAAQEGYAGSGACARCHADRLAAWTYSPHAQAYNTLLTRESGNDPECLACHTTGWGQPGGYGKATPAALRTWKAVQCEACHGPLGAHPHPQRGAPDVTEATCRSCHDTANSPSFDYASYLKRISCVMVSASEGAGKAPAERPLAPR
jgi:hypothetical protein